MKYLGSISDSKDLVNKGYVDDISEEVSELKSDFYKNVDEQFAFFKEINGTVQSGMWQNASFNPNEGFSKVFNVADTFKVKITRAVKAWYNIYTFTDDSDNPIKYQLATSTESSTDYIEYVPSGATKLFLSSGLSTDFADAIVNVYATTTDEVKSARGIYPTLDDRLNTFVKNNALSSLHFADGALNEFWYQNGNKNNGTPGQNLSKSFDVSGSKRIVLVAPKSIYRDLYDILDSEGNVLEKVYPSTNAEQTTYIIETPANAKTLVSSQTTENLSLVYAYVDSYSAVSDNTMEIKYLKNSKIDINTDTEVTGTNNTYWYQNKNKNTSSTTEVLSKSFDVSNYTQVKLRTYKSAYRNWYTFLDETGTILEYGISSSDVDIDEYTLTVPDGAVVLNTSQPSGKLQYEKCYGYTSQIDANKDNIDKLMPQKGKRIFWYGTSIPAAGFFGTSNPNGYPYRVAKKLGASCINLAVGSSCAHYKYADRVSESNPYGFGTNFEAASRCLSNSLTEMQWIIDNWDNGTFTRNLPQAMTAELEYQIKQCSYENRIDYYLDYEDRWADFWVFDHGHNDDMSHENEYNSANPFNLQTFRGAMNFLINRILSVNPKAKILMIGEYENQRSPEISENQEIVADDWGIPLMPLWNYLGWSQKVINTKGGWVNGYWDTDAYPSGHDITMLNAGLCDGIHPSSDLSNKTLEYEAVHIAEWMRGYINW